MDKPVEASKLEAEIRRWSGYARALRREDREAFAELIDKCKASGNPNQAGRCGKEAVACRAINNCKESRFSQKRKAS